MRRVGLALTVVAGLALVAIGVVAVDLGGEEAAAPAAVATPTPTATPAPTPTPTPTPTPQPTPTPTPAPPPELEQALASLLGDAALDGLDVGVSVWVDGYGEVFAHNADEPLLPASNQKLLTAIGALASLPGDDRFRTEVAVVGDDIALVAGGDPTLTRADLDRLAGQVSGAGVSSVPGDLVLDVSRYDAALTAPGWQDWHIPTYVGPLSALMVDDNRYRTDAAYLGDPALGNGEAFAAALARAGVTVGGGIRLGVVAEYVPVAAVESAPMSELIVEMLHGSDNEIADALVREIAYRSEGVGSTAAGLQVIAELIEGLGVDVVGVDGDGSGLSRANMRSAREWQEILVAARHADWFPALLDGLPVAGESGTMARRLAKPPTLGQVHAKTGTIIGGRALSGYVTTVAGRTAVFSILVNGEGSGRAVAVIDRIVRDVAAVA